LPDLLIRILYPVLLGYVELKGGSAADGTTAQIRNDKNQQTWKFEEIKPAVKPTRASVHETGVYKIINVKSGTTIDLSSDFRTIHGNKDQDGYNQQWRLRREAGHWIVMNLLYQRYLGYGSNTHKSGIHVEGSGDHHKHFWEIVNDSDDPSTFRIILPKTNLNVELARGDSVDGTTVQLWNHDTSRPQTWRFVETDLEETVRQRVPSKAIYKIVNVKSGTLIDLSASNGRDVRAYHGHNGRNQMWEVSRDGDFWYIRNVQYAHHLHLVNTGNATNGGELAGVTGSFIWNIFPDRKNKNVFRIFYPATDLNAEVDHGLSANGTKIRLRPMKEGAPQQTWKFVHVTHL